MFHRGRRLRRTAGMRSLVRETEIRPQDLVMPYFAVEGDEGAVNPIGSMPGQNQLGLKALEERVGKAVENGLLACILFGIPKEKDEVASQAYDDEGIVQQALRRLRRSFPDLLLITDVCLCEYTSHGHCGIVEDGCVINDASIDLLARTASSHARAGADIVAPSDMMDGRVLQIRKALDAKGFEEIPIMSYAVKYASAFYGPFREAAESTPQFGDRKTYQMDAANVREALRESSADIMEGADIIMVKPALPYLDILRLLKDRTAHPLAAYQVSGEYAMIKAAAANGWIDEKAIVMESLTSIKRAGADIIITYFAEDALQEIR